MYMRVHKAKRNASNIRKETHKKSKRISVMYNGSNRNPYLFPQMVHLRKKYMLIMMAEE
jgi:hypothetical protein